MFVYQVQGLQYIFSNITLQELNDKNFFSLDTCDASKAFHAVLCVHTEHPIHSSGIGMEIDGGYHNMHPIINSRPSKAQCFQINSCDIWAARPKCAGDVSRVSFFIYDMENAHITFILKQIDKPMKIGPWRDPYLRLNNLDIVQLENNGKEVYCTELPPPMYITEFENTTDKLRVAPFCFPQANYLPHKATQNRYMVYMYQSTDFSMLKEEDLNQSRTARRIAAKCSFERTCQRSFSFPSMTSSFLVPFIFVYIFFSFVSSNPLAVE